MVIQLIKHGFAIRREAAWLLVAIVWVYGIGCRFMSMVAYAKIS